MTLTCSAQVLAAASAIAAAAHSTASGGQAGYSLSAVFAFIGALLTLAALFSYVNVRFLALPRTTALMLMSLAASAVLYALARAHVPLAESLQGLIEAIPFRQLLLDGLLGLLLFAGALHVDLGDLLEHKGSIATFALLGTLGSTAAVAAMLMGVSRLMNLGLGWIDCLLFGALISPTDPIAVLGILKRIKVPKSLKTQIAGESLFNDGVGVVVFITLLGIASGGQAGPGSIAATFAVEAFGGIALGLVLGYAAYRMLRTVDDYQVEALITFALVSGGYALAGAIGTSGPLAMVAAGLLIGNQGRRLAMSDRTRENLDTFWELIDEILNAVLFVLIGMEVLVLTFSGLHILAGAIAVPMVLLARFVTIGVPVTVLRRWMPFAPHAVRVLTWGGLRGGISVALALSLPDATARDKATRMTLLAVTYFVVAFSIIVQGLTIGRLVRGAVRTSR